MSFYPHYTKFVHYFVCYNEDKKVGDGMVKIILISSLISVIVTIIIMLFIFKIFAGLITNVISETEKKILAVIDNKISKDKF